MLKHDVVIALFNGLTTERITECVAEGIISINDIVACVQDYYVRDYRHSYQEMNINWVLIINFVFDELTDEEIWTYITRRKWMYLSGREIDLIRRILERVDPDYSVTSVPTLIAIEKHRSDIYMLSRALERMTVVEFVKACKDRVIMTNARPDRIELVIDYMNNHRWELTNIAFYDLEMMMALLWLNSDIDIFIDIFIDITIVNHSEKLKEYVGRGPSISIVRRYEEITHNVVVYDDATSIKRCKSSFHDDDFSRLSPKIRQYIDSRDGVESVRKLCHRVKHNIDAVLREISETTD